MDIRNKHAGQRLVELQCHDHLNSQNVRSVSISFFFLGIKSDSRKQVEMREYERYYNEKVVKAAEGLKGYKGRRLLRSVENPEEGISITLWETKEDLAITT